LNSGGFSPFAIVADTLTHWTTSLTRNFVAGLPYQPIRVASGDNAPSAEKEDTDEQVQAAVLPVSGGSQIDRDRQLRQQALAAMLDPHLAYLCDALSIRIRLQRYVLCSV
jgi:hypothetical protein